MVSSYNSETILRFFSELAEVGELPATTIDLDNLRERTPLQLFDSRPDLHSSSCNLGTLGRLPVEVVHKTLSELDFKSIFHFRHVNDFALTTVHSHTILCQLMIYAPDVLRAMIATRLHCSSTSLADLHATLSSPHCAICGDFAPFLYLLTCSRICYRCLCAPPQQSSSRHSASAQSFNPTPMYITKQDVRLNLQHKYSMPSNLYALPGVYGPANTPIHKPLMLVESATAHAIWQSQHEELAAEEAAVQAAVTKNKRNRARRKQTLYFKLDARGRHTRPLTPAERTKEKETRIEENSMSARLRDLQELRDQERRQAGTVTGLLEPYRFMATVAAPWLERFGRGVGDVRVVEQGWACKACANMSLGPQNWRRRFTEEGLVRHVLDECWESRKKVEELLGYEEKLEQLLDSGE